MLNHLGLQCSDESLQLPQFVVAQGQRPEFTMTDLCLWSRVVMLDYGMECRDLTGVHVGRARRRAAQGRGLEGAK